MKEDIHPDYKTATISCACGNVVETRATVDAMRVDICSKCHPYFTGKRQQLVDRGGRVEQFRRRYNIADTDEEGEGAEAVEPAAEAAQT